MVEGRERGGEEFILIIGSLTMAVVCTDGTLRGVLLGDVEQGDR